jgi:hypothetical protein
VVARVHSSVLEHEDLPPGSIASPDLWKDRFEDVNAFERHMSRNGTVILKFFLHLSNDEQRKRLLKRIDTPDKNWKLSASDVHERKFWNNYQRAYEEMLEHTSTDVGAVVCRPRRPQVVHARSRRQHYRYEARGARPHVSASERRTASASRGIRRATRE